MVATHMHEDHIGGLITVLSSAIQVDEVIINNESYATQTYTQFMTLAKSHPLVAAQRGQVYTLTATVNLTVFNPVQPLEFTRTKTAS
jgi:beta-lactamase superfamily II metal-dependent hydrolase